ncbi:MAG: hypothetical protein LAT64_05830 [Phycisphaerales bacterium]|nr:hypothetical protein [Planctomycetota bacterium]MCH8508276.1 hypothetical protein [Phycisphaerales bacterium]
MTHDRTTLITGLLIVLAPAAAVYGSRHIGAGAGDAIGAEIRPLPSVPDFEPLTATKANPTRFADLPSPFWADPEPVQPEVVPEIIPEAPKAKGVPEFILSTVMPHPTRPLAVINGRPRAIGDPAAPGWTLTAIDGESRQVVLTGPDGQLVRVRLTTTRRP